MVPPLHRLDKRFTHVGGRVGDENSGVAHAEADDAQEVIGARMEQAGVDVVVCFDVFGSENWAVVASDAE